MGLFNFLFGSNHTHSNSVSTPETTDINPATGLPMSSGIGSVDVGGSPYGMDIHDDFPSTIDTSSCFDDSFSSIDSFDSDCSGFDDW